MHAISTYFHMQIWSLDGTVVQILDRSKSLSILADPSGVERRSAGGARANLCVRDVSWHSQVSFICALRVGDHLLHTVFPRNPF